METRKIPKAQQIAETGEYKKWNRRGVLVKHTRYENGKKHGVSVVRLKNGCRVEKTYDNGVLHGPYKETIEDGRPRVEKTYESGFVHGTKTKIYYGAKEPEIGVDDQEEISVMDKSDKKSSGRLVFPFERENDYRYYRSKVNVPPAGEEARKEVTEYDHGILHGQKKIYVGGMLFSTETYDKGVFVDSAWEDKHKYTRALEELYAANWQPDSYHKSASMTLMHIFLMWSKSAGGPSRNILDARCPTSSFVATSDKIESSVSYYISWS